MTSKDPAESASGQHSSPAFTVEDLDEGIDLIQQIIALMGPSSNMITCYITLDFCYEHLSVAAKVNAPFNPPTTPSVTALQTEIVRIAQLNQYFRGLLKKAYNALQASPVARKLTEAGSKNLADILDHASAVLDTMVLVPRHEREGDGHDGGADGGQGFQAPSREAMEELRTGDRKMQQLMTGPDTAIKDWTAVFKDLAEVCVPDDMAGIDLSKYLKLD